MHHTHYYIYIYIYIYTHTHIHTYTVIIIPFDSKKKKKKILIYKFDFHNFFYRPSRYLVWFLCLMTCQLPCIRTAVILFNLNLVGVHTFLQGISMKVNLIVQLERKLTYFKTAQSSTEAIMPGELHTSLGM